MSDDSSALADGQEPNDFQEGYKAAVEVTGSLIALSGLVEAMGTDPADEQVDAFRVFHRSLVEGVLALERVVSQIVPRLTQIQEATRGGIVSGCGVSGTCAHDAIYLLGGEVVTSLLLGGREIWDWKVVQAVFATINTEDLKRLETQARQDTVLAETGLMPRGRSTPAESGPMPSGDGESEARPGGEDASKKTDPKEKAGVFDLLVDENERSIRRLRYDKAVDLSGSPIRWHIFNVAYSAAPEQATLDDLKDDYPGEWDAHRNAVSELNDELKKIGIRVHNRTLQLVAPTSAGR